MRSAFASELVRLAEADERVVLLTGDLGFGVLEPFARRFPERFFNAGVAEQNMVGMATGLAEAGLTPYVYSIATFASMRGYEFIRNGPILHDLPVRVVGVGGGMDYGHNGMTHYAVEDIGIMRVQPNMRIVVPADPAQTRAALPSLQQIDGPVYLRLGKESSPVPGLDGRFRLGRAETIGHGEDVALIAAGGGAVVATAAAALLQERGLSARTVVVSSLNPAPVADLAAVLDGVELALTVEDHYVNGGLGSLVAETIAEERLGCRLLRAGLRRPPAGESGSRDHLFERHGLSPAALAALVLARLDHAGATAPAHPRHEAAT
ncbi:transketolase C-terminal domain-containing protein [Conexibacter stalactiti]|uniref:Transketolase C-terminal domain-containing protein n=1 Tax=Conexibacter stalactiti TaxID=1940611 RepID=A0ABU4HS53_9ACTN|nr:transketolase C-terminal domain-containing protein [Conexibacter stalactiti]MDW5596157.1 transketolase C-terminal domain-containing protein [Conexibacter stalactiti]MEC5036799.1 transketolase C-terminal domain-containing protein [Conexibacter stalactiti]